MTKMLVGYTGFVGSNLKLQSDFDYLINSKNIDSAYGVKPDLLVYSGVPAEMFIANKYPERDMQIIENAKENIRRIGANTVVLISTVAVYDVTYNRDENSKIDNNLLTPYGRNRLELEKWVKNNYESHLIIRLPAIYGENLKKNFIYDFINFVPAMLKEDKYNELSADYDIIKNLYKDQDNGFFKYFRTDDATHLELVKAFEAIGFSALNFTDSRSIYQFYNLKNLYAEIENCLSKGIKKINLVTPPISVSEVYLALTGNHFQNELAKEPFNYNLKTVYSKSGYIMTKEQELQDIIEFVKQHKIGD